MSTYYLITGANRGIGFALAKALLERENTFVFATAREPENAIEFKEFVEAGSLEDRCRLLPLDINSPESILNLAQALQGSPIDFLINNAGRFTPSGTLPDLDFDAIVADFTTNTVGTLRLIQALLLNVSESKAKTIVNVSSKMGSIADNGSGGQYAYRLSKAALNMATKGLAVDLKERGVTVVALHPGWVKTRMGGENAPLTIDESIKGICELLDSKITLEKSGAFLNYDGTELPW